MFYTQKHKDNMDYLNVIVKEQDRMIREQNELIKKQQGKLNFLFSRIENHINECHPYGSKKDGTPRAKPGRKTA